MREKEYSGAKNTDNCHTQSKTHPAHGDTHGNKDAETHSASGQKI